MKLFSFGGGVQSTACLVLAAQGKIDYQHFIFANVGDQAENPATIAYIKKFSKPFALAHGIELIEVCRRDRAGNPIDLYEHLHKPIRSVDIPLKTSPSGAPGNRNCTSEWKIKPIAKFIKKNSQFKILGKGISTDEISRARTNSGFDFYSVEYPLIDLNLSRLDCMRIIADAGLPSCPKSSCWFCPFKSLGDWQSLNREQPQLIKSAATLEKFLHAKREAIGRDKMYLTARGAKTGATLDEIVSDQLSLFDEMPDLDFCDSGYCMV